MNESYTTTPPLNDRETYDSNRGTNTFLVCYECVTFAPFGYSETNDRSKSRCAVCGNTSEYRSIGKPVWIYRNRGMFMNHHGLDIVKEGTEIYHFLMKKLIVDKNDLNWWVKYGNKSS